jgi:hypothetical protein
MKRLLLLLIPLALACETPDLEKPKQKDSFAYFGFGGTVLSVNPQPGDVIAIDPHVPHVTAYTSAAKVFLHLLK